MEFLIDLLCNLLIDDGALVVKNKRVSKWIRYPLAFLMILFYLAVILLILYFAIELIILNEGYSVYAGVFFLIIDVLFIYFSIKKSR